MTGELDYTCKVIHVYDLADDGSLKNSNWEEQFRGSEFLVSRVTGEFNKVNGLNADNNTNKIKY